VEEQARIRRLPRSSEEGRASLLSDQLVVSDGAQAFMNVEQLSGCFSTTSIVADFCAHLG